MSHQLQLIDYKEVVSLLFEVGKKHFGGYIGITYEDGGIYSYDPNRGFSICGSEGCINFILPSSISVPYIQIKTSDNDKLRRKIHEEIIKAFPENSLRVDNPPVEITNHFRLNTTKIPKKDKKKIMQLSGGEFSSERDVTELYIADIA